MDKKITMYFFINLLLICVVYLQSHFADSIESRVNNTFCSPFSILTQQYVTYCHTLCDLEENHSYFFYIEQCDSFKCNYVEFFSIVHNMTTINKCLSRSKKRNTEADITKKVTHALDVFQTYLPVAHTLYWKLITINNNLGGVFNHKIHEMDKYLKVAKKKFSNIKKRYGTLDQ